jgi:ubiquinone biosynthesis protein
VDLKAVKHLGRFKDIVVTLFRYGFDDVVERLEFPGKVLLEKIHRVRPEMNTWERIRHILEDLGPTFIKFGQLMSLRPDLIPNALILELRKLQDEVAPVPYEAIREVVEKSLQVTLAEIFLEFDEKPLAAASLAQVHRAVIKSNGVPVAVKAQRPGIRQVIETDLSIMETIAHRLDERMEAARVYDLPNLVREIKKGLLGELDFSREARHMKIFEKNSAGQEGVCIPRLYDEYSSSQVLTMELIRGTKLKDLTPSMGVDRELLARRGLQLTVKQILGDGFFHADPHPGNIMVLDGNVMCLLDWGLVGRLTRRSRYEIIDLIDAVVEKDSEAALRIILSLARPRVPVNRSKLEREVLDILDIYHGLPVRDLNIGHLLLDVSSMLRENRLQVPMDLAIMIKALVTAEGTARELYPELDVVEEARPYVKHLALERWKPAALWQNLRRNVADLVVLQKEFPARLNQIVERIERGELSIRFQHANLGGLRNTLENVTNRLTLGIIIAALIIGSSMIITTGVRPLLFGFPALGIVGYLVSGLLGVWLIINILRSRRF